MGAQPSLWDDVVVDQGPQSGIPLDIPLDIPRGYFPRDVVTTIPRQEFMPAIDRRFGHGQRVAPSALEVGATCYNDLGWFGMVAAIGPTGCPLIRWASDLASIGCDGYWGDTTRTFMGIDHGPDSDDWLYDERPLYLFRTLHPETERWERALDSRHEHLRRATYPGLLAGEGVTLRAVPVRSATGAWEARESLVTHNGSYLLEHSVAE
jgi:hypothetical protein